MALLLSALGRSDAARLVRFAGGTVRDALEEAGELLVSPEWEEAGGGSGSAAEELFRRELGRAAVHDSWFLEPLETLPAGLIPSVCAMYPPRLMRHVANLAEERLGASFGKITLDDASPPAARLLAYSLLPPSAPVQGEKNLPDGMRSDPLPHLARRPFVVEEAPREPVVRGIMEDAGARLEAAAAEAMGDEHVPGIGASLSNLALALARHPESAACLALAAPRRVGRVFLLLSKTLALLAGDETVERCYEELAGRKERGKGP
jgi:hypothetical protein